MLGLGEIVMVALNTKIFATVVQPLAGVTLALTPATSRLQVKLKVACTEFHTSGASVFRASNFVVPLPWVAFSTQLSVTVIAVTPLAKVTV